MPRTSVLAILFGASVAHARGAAHYSLENGKIVVEQDGIFEDVAVDCEESHELVEHDGNLYVACGSRGIAVYSLANPLQPKLAGRVETSPCEHLAADGTCSASTRIVRAHFTSSARAEDIDRASCSTAAPQPFELVCSRHPLRDGAIAIVVRTDGSNVVLEADVPEGASLDAAREAVTEGGRRIKTKLIQPVFVAQTPGVVEREKEEPTPPPKAAKWYGVQTLAMDGVSVLALFPILIPGIVGFAVGSPIIHWVHGNVGAGFASLGIRLGGGTLIGTGGAVAGSYGSANGPIGGTMIVIGVATLITATVLDAAVFAYDDPPKPSAKLSPFGFTF